MTEQTVPYEEKLIELAQIYGWLRRDASEMLHDLLQGVSLYRSTSRMLFGFAILTFLLVPLFVWGSVSSGNGTSLAVGLGLIAIFMLALGITTLWTGLRYRTRYAMLRSKYSELYIAARKLA